MLTLTAGTLFSCLAAYHGYSTETQRILDEFALRTVGVAVNIEDRIGALEAPGNGMAAHIAASMAHQGFFDEAQFATWARARQGSLSLAPRLYYWRPLVRHRDRPAFEVSAIPIVELDDHGNLIAASSREYYLPLHYAVSEGNPNAAVLGLDGLKEPHRAEPLQRAWRSGLPQLSRPYRVFAFAEQHNPGVFFASPVFAGGTVPDSLEHRQSRLLGVVGTAYSLAEILNHAIKGAPGTKLDIYVGTAPFAADGSGTYVARYDPRAQAFTAPANAAATGTLAGHKLLRPIHLGGTEWHLLFHVKPADIDAARSWEPLLVLVIGLLLTGGSAVLVKAASNRREQLRLEIASSHTQLKATESELAVAKIHFSTLVETSPAAIVCLDDEERVILWNPAAERLFGYAAAEVLGKTVPKNVLGRSLSAGWSTCETRTGRSVTISSASAPLRDESGRETGRMYVLADQTERVLLENQLRQAQKMEAVGQLTGGIAHDFNNLLGIVIGNLDLLEGQVLPQGEELRQAALGAALRGAELTRALLAFSRRQELNPTAVDVGELLQRLVRLLQRTLGEPIDVLLERQQGLWPVHIDAAQLEAAVTNIAINARDAMAAGGRLLIRASNARLDEEYASQNLDVVPGDYTLVEVVDTGHGMPPEVLAHVFEPFFTTKEKGRGTGLGLAMVYGFVKQSGGHIKIYSEVGHGTAVRLYLPRLQDEAAAAAPSCPAPPLTASGETILVVEDNADLRRTMVKQLNSLGYTVVEAENGVAAMELLRGPMACDLLFTDVVMPGGMTGFDVAREARRLRPSLKILLTSGFPGTMSTKEREIAPGLSPDLLGKPFRKEQLAEKVREVLDHG